VRTVVAEGREAIVYLQDDGTVVKVLREGIDPELAQREADVCGLLTAMGQSAPVVHGVVDVDGRPGLVMDRVDGTNLLGALEANPLRVLTAARVLGDVHARLHEVRAPSELPELHQALGDRIRAAPPLPAHLRGVALSVLEQLPTGDRLCHSDFHLGNMLGTWKEPVVIDWAHAVRGDPMSDVARTDLLHRHGALPPGTPRFFRAVAAVGRQVLANRYLATYKRHRTLEPTLNRWRLVHIAARLNEPIPEEQQLMLDLLEDAVTTQ
jgi:thiamine kinase